MPMMIHILATDNDIVQHKRSTNFDEHAYTVACMLMAHFKNYGYNQWIYPLADANQHLRLR